jgi:hypothetical protein
VASVKIGGCVELPDGRVGRVRERVPEGYKIRVQRKTSRTHQFIVLPPGKLRAVDCPKGWMSPDGYNRYLKTTLEKLRKRQASAKPKTKSGRPSDKPA